MRLRGGKTEEKVVKIVEIDPKSETSLTLRLGMTVGKRPCAIHQLRRHSEYPYSLSFLYNLRLNYMRFKINLSQGSPNLGQLNLS